jgi:hypothetical protein
MRDEKTGRSLARHLVLAVAVLLYVSAGVVYIGWAPEFLWGVGILGSIATVYLFIYLFASEKACEKSLFFLAWIL